MILSPVVQELTAENVDDSSSDDEDSDQAVSNRFFNRRNAYLSKSDKQLEGERRRLLSVRD